jgi:hypothetical protein
MFLYSAIGMITERDFCSESLLARNLKGGGKWQRFEKGWVMENGEQVEENKF